MIKAASVIAPSESEQQLADQGFRRAKNDRVWDWLKDVNSNIRAFTAVPATLLPFMRDDVLCEKVASNHENILLMKLGQRLIADVQEFNQQLVLLASEHQNKRGSSATPDELMKSIDISQRYLAYIAEYERVVLPTVHEMLEIFERGGLDTTSIRTSADSGLVYKLFDDQSTNL